jgi:hypothetical protein
MNFGICSFSFHRLLAAGKQDIFQYILDCKALGCTQLDPWNAHLSELKSGDDAIHAGHNPSESHHLTAMDEGYIDRVRQAGDDAGLPFGTIAVDGAHLYDANEEYRNANRARAYRWLDIAARLGASQVRIDTGGTEDLPDEQMQIIKEGYTDLIDRGAKHGIEILVENHWGATPIPENLHRIFAEVPGLGLLYDSHNFKPELRDEGRRTCAKYAKAVHIKTFAFDADGNELEDKPEIAIDELLKVGYAGTWGVESVPRDGDEIGGARDTIAFVRRQAAAAQVAA